MNENNINNKPKRGRPRKNNIVINNKPKIENKIENEPIIKPNYDNSDDEIRAPDKIIKDKLIDIDDDININEYDDDLTKAIKISRLEYLYKNNMLPNSYSNIEPYNSNNSNYYEFEPILDNNFDKNYNINKINNETNEEIENELENIINKSNEELEEKNKLIEQQIKEESEKIEKENRLKSLEIFSKKIKALTFTKTDIEVKNYTEQILDDYFNLKLDYIIVEDENLYKNLFEIIDSYYKIPKMKNQKRLGIPEEEDKILRTIFRK